MKEKRKIIQIILVFFGLVLIIFTYFLYPSVNQNKVLESENFKEKINLEKEIAKLEIKKQELLDKIKETKKLLASDSTKKKDILVNIENDLEKTASTLAEKKLVLQEKEIISEKDNKNEVARKEIVKLKKKEQILIDKIKEKKEYLSSPKIAKREEKIKKLEKKEQELISQIQSEKEYEDSGGKLKKGSLEKLRTHLQKTSTTLAKRRLNLDHF